MLALFSEGPEIRKNDSTRFWMHLIYKMLWESVFSRSQMQLICGKVYFPDPEYNYCTKMLW